MDAPGEGDPAGDGLEPVNAREWLSSYVDGPADIAVLGAPIARASISPSQAHTTPPAFRRALEHLATWDGEHGVEITALRCLDLGDIEGDAGDPDCTAAHARLVQAGAAAATRAPVVAVIGGDNSVTLAGLHGISGGRLGEGWGLLTLDAHHDVRPRAADGLPRNGTPVRDLIEAGLPGKRVAQVGLQPFASAREHAEWAAEQGIHTRRAGQVRSLGAVEVISGVLAALDRAGARRVHLDIDVDVLDRCHAPACPASLPGGLTPALLQDLAYYAGRDPRVVSVDLVEVDAAADVADMTVRAMASVFLAFCAGVATRRGGRRR